MKFWWKIIYTKSLTWQTLTKVNKIIRLKLIKEVIYFLKFLKKLERYNKKYLIYTKDRSSYCRKKNGSKLIYISNIELQN